VSNLCHGPTCVSPHFEREHGVRKNRWTGGMGVRLREISEYDMREGRWTDGLEREYHMGWSRDECSSVRVRRVVFTV
jgi:hypothetical protein